MPPPSLETLETSIYQAIEEMGNEESLKLLGQIAGEAPRYYEAHLRMEHSVPSPSSISRCRLQQYFKATGQKPDVNLPAAWTKRSAAGVMTEAYWLTILRLAGLDIQLPSVDGYECGSYMMAHPDSLIGGDGLLELKDKNGWAYKRLIEGQGVAYEEPSEYTQTQLYLQATGRSWALYLASPADPAMLESMMRNYNKYKDIPDWHLPLFYLEGINRREQDIQAGLARADMVHHDLSSTETGVIPPREYDGKELNSNGKTKAFPCGYCQFQKTCVEVYG